MKLIRPSTIGKRRWLFFALAATALALAASAPASGGGNVGFGFNARDISGFPTGSATLTGGGAYNPVTGFVNSGGGFRCTSDIGQGPLMGCLAGEANEESFTAQMIVSADDLAPDIAGTQNVWIQGVGCAPAIANFSS